MADERTRVLIVEEDRSLRDLLSLILRDEGYAIRGVADAREALHVAHSWRPGVVVLDGGLGDPDGGTFRAEGLCRGLPEIPLLLLSDAPQPEAQAQSTAATLRKPFDLDDLIGEVRRLTSSGTPPGRTGTRDDRRFRSTAPPFVLKGDDRPSTEHAAAPPAGGITGTERDGHDHRDALRDGPTRTGVGDFACEWWPPA